MHPIVDTLSQNAGKISESAPVQMSWFMEHSYIILLLPLLSFIINGLFIARWNQVASGWVSTIISALTLGFIGIVAAEWYQSGQELLVPWDFTWLKFNDALQANIGAYLDPIAVMMLVVVGVIALLVHIYSMGYMKDDPSKGRFFPLLSLFVFSMMGLVISTNLLQMFVFWELVGVSSYSLIGFWYHKPSAVDASKKAFIVTRFADAFFLLGIVILSFVAGSLDFNALNGIEAAKTLGSTDINLGFFTANALGIGTLFVFTGGWGKSAMFPMHIWLPDAMEGPTPVSSIIHSATMVVAGVFLTARMFPLFSAAEYTMHIVTGVGLFTALFAAVIAITQRDIKRILAFSTLSQLGYMMFSLGVAKMVAPHDGVSINTAGYTASMYHVFTHAFFKCMLFLGAGAIIHAVHSNNIDKMGGLRKKMPITWFALLTACLAIAGIFPFSGFFSKDSIILAALQSGHYVAFALGLLVGGLTAFYMFRFFFLIFHGEPRSDLSHAHEDPFMTLPIALLIIPTIGAGLLNNVFTERMHPLMPANGFHGEHPHWLPFVATGVGLIGIILAWFLYARKGAKIEKAVDFDNRPNWFRHIYNKFYFDEIWYFFAKTLIIRNIAALIKAFDHWVIDGLINLTGGTLRLGGSIVRALQNGKLAFYLAMTALGVLFIVYFTKLPL